MIVYTKDRQYFRFDGKSQELKPVPEDEALLEIMTGVKKPGRLSQVLAGVFGFLIVAAAASVLIAIIIWAIKWGARQ